MTSVDWGTAMLLVGPILGLGVCGVAHVVVSRALRTLPHQHGVMISVLAGGALVVAGMGVAVRGDAGGLSTLDAWGLAIAAGLTYVLLAYCYVIGFFNIGESARRIRLLIELESAGKQGLTLEEILAVYNARMIIEARLGRLLSGGQIVERSRRYLIKRRLMLHAAQCLRRLQVGLPRNREAAHRPAAGSL